MTGRCEHVCRVEFGSFVLCLDCGWEKPTAVPDLPAPIALQHVERAQTRVGLPPTRVGVQGGQDPAGVPCPSCGHRFTSLHALVAHAASSCVLEGSRG